MTAEAKRIYINKLSKYSGTLLIWSPMDHKNRVALFGHINRVGIY